MKRYVHIVTAALVLFGLMLGLSQAQAAGGLKLRASGNGGVIAHCGGPSKRPRCLPFNMAGASTAAQNFDNTGWTFQVTFESVNGRSTYRGYCPTVRVTIDDTSVTPPATVLNQFALSGTYDPSGSLCNYRLNGYAADSYHVDATGTTVAAGCDWVGLFGVILGHDVPQTTLTTDTIQVSTYTCNSDASCDKVRASQENWSFSKCPKVKKPACWAHNIPVSYNRMVSGRSVPQNAIYDVYWTGQKSGIFTHRDHDKKIS